MELETIDKLYLELSQFTTAITKRELDLMKRIKVLEDALMRITYELGVPQPGYPQPAANAYDIAQAALEVK